MGSQSPVSEHPKKKKKKEKKRSKSRSPKRSKRDKSETRNGKIESNSDTEDLKKKVTSPRISASPPPPPPRSPSTDRRLSSKARSPMVRKSRSPSKKKRRSRSISPVRKRRKSPEVLDEFGRVVSYRKKETKEDRREERERTEREREREPKREPRVDLYDKREDMMRRKRLADIESKLTEVETQRTIDECVNKRVREEMAKKDSEIDAEVCRRVDDAKKILERSMKEELDSKKEEMEKEIESQEEEHQKEIQSLQSIVESLKLEMEESKLRLDEERLEVVEAKRKVEEERQMLEKELKKKEKMIQNQILGKNDSNNSRPRISFGLKK